MQSETEVSDARPDYAAPANNADQEMRERPLRNLARIGHCFIAVVVLEVR